MLKTAMIGDRIRQSTWTCDDCGAEKAVSHPVLDELRRVVPITPPQGWSHEGGVISNFAFCPACQLIRTLSIALLP